jgi:hypothetical protein
MKQVVQLTMGRSMTASASTPVLMANGDVAFEGEAAEVDSEVILQWVGNRCSRGENSRREECGDDDNAGETHPVSKSLKYECKY